VVLNEAVFLDILTGCNYQQLLLSV